MSQELTVLFDLFRDTYYAELQRKDSIDQHISFPFGVLVVLASAILYCMRMCIDVKCPCWGRWLFVVSLISLFGLLVTAVLLATAYWKNRRYKHLPYADVLTKYAEKVREWAQQPGHKAPEDQLISSQMQQVLIDHFSHCASNNARLNDNKAALLANAKVVLIITTIIFLVCSAYPAYQVAKADPKIQKTEITNLGAWKEVTSSARQPGEATRRRQALATTSAASTTQGGDRRSEARQNKEGQRVTDVCRTRKRS